MAARKSVRTLDIRPCRHYLCCTDPCFGRDEKPRSLSCRPWLAMLTAQHRTSKPSLVWRRGREAEGGGLLNRYTVKSRIEGSNPSVSATLRPAGFGGLPPASVPRHNAASTGVMMTSMPPTQVDQTEPILDHVIIERERDRFAGRALSSLVLLNGAAALVLLAILAQAEESTVEPKFAAAMMFFSGGAVAALLSAFIAYINRTLQDGGAAAGELAAYPAIPRYRRRHRQRCCIPHRHEHGGGGVIGEIEHAPQRSEGKAAAARSRRGAKRAGAALQRSRRPCQANARGASPPVREGDCA